MTRRDQECETCFLSSRFPGITFGEDGACNYCESAGSGSLQNAASREPNLTALAVLGEQIRKASRSRGAAYDAIIGASGGLDSTYVIYLAKEVMGLNPLAIKYSNGFGHPLADDNLRTACQKLSVDLITVPPVRLERQYLHHAIKAFRNLDIFFSICFSCHFIIAAVVYQHAMARNIGFMLTSTNPFESHLSMTSHGHMARQIVSAFWKAGVRDKLSFVTEEVKAQVALLRLKHSFDGFSRRWIRNAIRLHPVAPTSIQKIDLSRHVPWDLKSIEAFLRAELGWQSPRNTQGPYMRFDCHILSLIDYSFLKTAGISEHGLLTNFMVQGATVEKESVREDFEFFNDAARCTAEANQVLEELGVQKLDTLRADKKAKGANRPAQVIADEFAEGA